MNIYRNKTWEQIRRFILDRDQHFCQQSLREGKVIPADTVHHIYPIETHPELAYEYWNLISVCRREHNKLHERKSHRITEKGKLLQRRRRNDYLRWCRENEQIPHFD